MFVAAAALVVLIALGAFAAFSETPGFCRTCHEMGPYYDAWGAGRHAGRAECVDCHIDAGLVAHIAHKPSEMREVWDHFFADSRFPNYTVDVPNGRCERCHPSVNPRVVTSGVAPFSHALHETKARCRDCHAVTGHEVSLDALRAAGVLKGGASAPPVPAGMTPSVAPGHIRVVCQRCHDQARMKCTACHQAPHDPKGECDRCHQPGMRFRFVHPAVTADCSKCHTLPASHPAAKGACGSCHRQPGTGWAFTHPEGRPDCGTCHQPPANHFGPGCASCHSPSVPFAAAVFNHVGDTGDHSWRSFPCARCHPKGYTSASCTCHGGRPPAGG